MRGWNMVPEPVEEAIHAIADDRTSGASKLARRAPDTMGLAIREAKGRPEPNDLPEAARRISAAQPAMAIVHNVAHLVARLVSEGQDPKAVFEATRAELDGTRSRIARTFLKIAPPRGIVVTLSSSETVLEALKLANARGLIVRVDVLESGPGFEGRTFAAARRRAQYRGAGKSLIPRAGVVCRDEEPRPPPRTRPNPEGHPPLQRRVFLRGPRGPRGCLETGTRRAPPLPPGPHPDLGGVPPLPERQSRGRRDLAAAGRGQDPKVPGAISRHRRGGGGRPGRGGPGGGRTAGGPRGPGEGHRISSGLTPN